MELERSTLHESVMAFLRPFCEQLHLELRVMDPHYGVGSGLLQLHPEHMRRVRQEAERCIQRSAATAFVCIVGDLYETSILPADIREDEFNQLSTFLLQNMGSEAPIAARLLDKWCVVVERGLTLNEGDASNKQTDNHIASF